MTAGDAARLFLDKAREDEAVLLKLAPDPDISDEPVGFHAQQAIEKLLKAVLVLEGVAIRRTHDIDGLCEEVQELGIILPVDPDALAVLTPFAVEFRYTHATTEEGGLDRTAACLHVRALRTWVEARVTAAGPGGESGR